MRLLVEIILMQILGIFLLYSLADAFPTSLWGTALNSEAVIRLESELPKNISVHLSKVEQVATSTNSATADLRLTYSGVVLDSNTPLQFSKILRVKKTGPQSVETRLIRP